MKIAIAASGTRGDVQPYVALGKGLHAAGYSVRVLTSDDFAGLVTDAGLEFCSTGASIEGMLQSKEWRDAMESGNFLKILARMTSETKRRAQDLAQNMPDLFAGADLILAGMGGLGGSFSIAEKLNLPVIQADVFPITPTRMFPSPLTPTLPFGGLLNGLSFRAMRQMLWQTTRAADVTTRRALGLPAASFWGPFRSLQARRVPVLYGYSNHVLPRPNDWDALNHVTGYWFLDAPADWVAPQGLTDFLRAGAPPVYIGFGSMGNRNPEATTQIALKALALSGQRGVLASGWGGLSQADLPANVHMIASVPHSWLFPQMAAVVHHGGAGTTAAGLRAGVPTTVVPFFGDQPFWGQRVAALGVGSAPIPKRRLTAERLSAAITQMVSDQALRQRAADLGEHIRAEDGIADAVEQIERLTVRSSRAFSS
ncbi:MAG: glycosyltransferase [Chloroflexota bacterium]|nr:glycosyltransferase [Chloroflexota bacterium]